ncbi:hypothetical protein [Paenibacillus lutrae]|uniref:Tetratricopeptide repeat protein n=1 Tax=Paenibacillus lutrae TaxID=2078573 RepID=A0A7X3JYD9_9BACL|nr:hypothetical protein [Paenibacillus lutrae]MVO98882.1 hypothetical protein [Paenibacillus lutrae]
MKKRWQFFLALLITAGLLTGAYLYWNKPYKLPPVSDEMKLAEFNLVFDQERSVQIAGDASVDELKRLVTNNPDNLAYSNELRLKMGKSEQTEAFISFMTEMNNPPARAKLQLALGYIDRMQNQSLGTASLGQISVHSINQLNEILEKDPYDWLAHYARGINNLYWPVGLQRIDKSIQDLSFCLAVTKKFEQETPFYMWALAYTALGDALVKKGEVGDGIDIWKQGYKSHPDDAGLKERAAASREQALEIVIRDRGMDQFQRPSPDIGDLSPIWKPSKEGQIQ